MRRFLLAALTLVLAQPPAPSSMTTSYETATLGPGVTAFLSPPGLGAWVTGNSLVVVGDSAALVVDPGHFPPLTRKMIADVRRLTDKPVRWVVDTHWHPDHWMGNAEYADAYPGVTFVGAPATRDSIVAKGPAFVKGHQDSAAVYKGYEAMLGKDESSFRPGRPMASGERYALGLAVADGRAAFPGWQEARVVAPTLTVADSLTLHLGRRDVQIRFLGRANTAGDVVVWVPDARVLAAGDLVVAPIPYAYGSYIGEWIDVLGRLRAFGARTLLPGHGPVQHDLGYVDRVAAALRTLRDRAADAAGRGLTLDSARRSLSFDDLERQFEADDPHLRGLLFVHFLNPGLPRAYEEARGASR